MLIFRYNLSQDPSDVNIVHMDRWGGRNLNKFRFLLTFHFHTSCRRVSMVGTVAATIQPRQ